MKKSKPILTILAVVIIFSLGYAASNLHSVGHHDAKNDPPMISKTSRTLPSITQKLEELKDERDRLAHDYREQAKQLQLTRSRLDSEQRQKSALQSNLSQTRLAVANHTSGMRTRMATAIKRNAASLGTGIVPVFGDTADAASTVIDIAEYCRIQSELDDLNQKVGNPAKRASRIEETCRMATDGRLARWPRVRLPF